MHSIQISWTRYATVSKKTKENKKSLPLSLSSKSFESNYYKVFAHKQKEEDENAENQEKHTKHNKRKIT